MMPFYRLPRKDGLFNYNGEPIVAFHTKKEAVAFARQFKWNQRDIQRIGNRFWLGWALYCPVRNGFVGECPVMEFLRLRPYGHVHKDFSSQKVQWSSDTRR